ncbi:UDP-glucose 4-epimerase GalE [Glycomyces sp. TRM65418]|uniref:UDP-glucose 4-epimerase GalE n=1 Tax=Glycomyces sp. TRM65418 TaxID=2867006 RepID=UPI001CE5F3EE|nr:UDP-glucose 4-epimerase GalE [Glycomyces sp. TRM65418]MCC3763595.1 UDP-glucose 4-epimerase GalE [Glycomyces sp. TRM65418]QZD57577.1 UDP-glucose 4-epimerase GalE [Glycomyces sp. TRM65418]
MKYLVTGGAGYIGSIVATMLLEEGHEVVVLDDCSTGAAERVPAGATLVRKRVQDAAEVLDDSFDGVLHFGGLIAAGESMAKPEIYWEANTTATFGLLNAMREANVRTLVFSSTAAVYGNPTEVPIKEDAAKAPTSTYGASKLASDMAISSEVTAHGLAAVSLRYFNVVGAYQDKSGLWHGENHDPETHIIPIAFEAATGERPSFGLFGDDYPTPDGTCIRDYIHVADLAEAHLLALRAAEPGQHKIYNLGNGNGFSNKEVVATVKKITGADFPVEIGPRRPGDPAELVASSERARTELGWKPSRETLDRMVADAWEYYRHARA